VLGGEITGKWLYLEHSFVGTSAAKELLRRSACQIFRPYGKQLAGIKKSFLPHRMNERLINKLGQVLYLHLINWQPEQKDVKLRELGFVENFVGQMGNKSKIELVKPFGYSRLTDGYLTDYIVIKRRLAALMPPNADILDLGCGTGWFSICLSYEGYNVDGVELSPLAVEIATERYLAWPKGGACTFIAGDFESVKLGKKYDAVLIYEALHHAQDPPRVIATAASALKNGGYLVLKEPNLIWSFTGIRSSYINENTERGFSKHYLKRILNDCGFRDVRFFKNKLGFFIPYCQILCLKALGEKAHYN
jgi:2-polyprenyl-3-methyl-5-hydroxy-6-metoxy-1,4-benzoquinol methylase